MMAYAESKEFLAGFGIIDVPDLDTALEWAARHPAAAFTSVEVRPLLGSHFSVGGPAARPA
ncbi:YciI family protein [Verrucomicrobium spinosum]|uniref:YciI family protein n=1 Tax=Verrucomicrobium spinosum TaxID=2736 RepID=UPI00210C2D45|nr:YciI family protein [Verrucomicrobium spinosum]